jgi:hypothetical protein
VKESNPVKVAEYAVAEKLATEQAFSWWVSYTHKKLERIVAAVKNRYLFVELPESVQDALRIEEQTNTAVLEGCHSAGD